MFAEMNKKSFFFKDFGRDRLSDIITAFNQSPFFIFTCVKHMSSAIIVSKYICGFIVRLLKNNPVLEFLPILIVFLGGTVA